MKKLVLVVLLLVLLAGCGPVQVAVVTPAPTPSPILTPTPTPCYVQAAPYVEAVLSLAQEWDDANSLAAGTPRVSLSPAIAALQEIRRRADVLEHPDCVEDVHSTLIRYMDDTIDAYLLFLSGEMGFQRTSKMSEAGILLQDWGREMQKLQSGQPPYDQ
jgi:hypothetical protein